MPGSFCTAARRDPAPRPRTEIGVHHQDTSELRVADYELRVTKSCLALLASLPPLRHFPFPLRILAVVFRFPGNSPQPQSSSSRGRLCSHPLSHHRTCFIASGGSPRNRLDDSITASSPRHFLAQRRGRLGPLAESQQLHCLRPASSSSIRSILPSSPVPRAAQVLALLDVRPFSALACRYYDLC